MFEAELLLGRPGSQLGLENVSFEQSHCSSRPGGSDKSALIASTGHFLECCQHETSKQTKKEATFVDVISMHATQGRIIHLHFAPQIKKTNPKIL